MKEVDNLIHGRTSRRDFFSGSGLVLSSLALTACTGRKEETAPSVVATATAAPKGQGTPRPDVTRTPAPELSLAQKAMREGRLAVSEKDWDKYFVAISADEAKGLLDKAGREGKFTYLLPFDPRVENLAIETSNSQGPRLSRIGVTNLPTGSTIYSPFDGKSRIGNIADIVNGKPVMREVLPTVQSDNYQFTLYGGLDLELRKGMTPSNPLKEEVIKLGDSLAVVKEGKIRKEGFSVMYDITKGSENFSLASLTNLLTKDGKIAFIAQDKK